MPVKSRIKTASSAVNVTGTESGVVSTPEESGTGGMSVCVKASPLSVSSCFVVTCCLIG